MGALISLLWNGITSLRLASCLCCFRIVMRERPGLSDSRWTATQANLPGVAERDGEALVELVVLGLESGDLFVRAGQAGF